jgi:hypothetical protein
MQIHSFQPIGLDITQVEWYDGLLYRTSGVIPNDELNIVCHDIFSPGSWVCSRDWLQLEQNEFCSSLAASQNEHSVSLLTLSHAQLEACRNALGKHCLDLALIAELRKTIPIVSKKPIIRAIRRPVDGPTPSTTCEWEALQQGTIRLVGLHRDALGEPHVMFNLGLFDRFFTFVAVVIPEDTSPLPWETLRTVGCYIVRLQPGWGFVMSHPSQILHDGLLTHQGPDYVLQIHEAAATMS